jgi:hypothetical protein
VARGTRGYLFLSSFYFPFPSSINNACSCYTETSWLSSQQLGIHLISILAIITTDLNTVKMQIHSVLAGIFLLLAVAIASVPQIEIKASNSSLFGAFKQLTRSPHRVPSSFMPTMARNCELINYLKLLQLLILRLVTSVALPTRVWILDNETLPTLT